MFMAPKPREVGEEVMVLLVIRELGQPKHTIPPSVVPVI